MNLMNPVLYRAIATTSIALVLAGCISAKSRPVELSEEATPAPAPAPAVVDIDSDGDGVLDSADRCPDTAPGVKVDSTGCEIVFTLKGVNFDTDKSTLKAGAAERLLDAAAIISSNPNANYEIAGHTDSDGTDEYNKSLGYRRAVTVLNFLTRNGVRQSRLSTESYGESRPVASNDTEEGKAMNRRVEIVAIPN